MFSKIYLVIFVLIFKMGILKNKFMNGYFVGTLHIGTSIKLE